MWLRNTCDQPRGKGTLGYGYSILTLQTCSGGEMAKSTNVLALLLRVGLLQVRILVAARRGKNVWNIGKPPAPNSVPYVPQHIDGRPAM